MLDHFLDDSGSRNILLRSIVALDVVNNRRLVLRQKSMLSTYREKEIIVEYPLTHSNY